MTKFFKPISVSATHIYHSALELSPLSSVVRKLYYHQRDNLFPRVVAGTPDSWNESMYLSGVFDYISYTWSPCGQFVAVQTQGTVKIHDPFSSEQLSTLTQADAYLTGELAYSPDGHSLACLSHTALVIWDIQTGGVAKEIGGGAINSVSLVWSLDGGTISTILQDWITHPILPLSDQGAGSKYAVHVYNVASGTILSPGILQSRSKPHLWAYNTSFRVMTVEWNGQTCTVKISEVGPILTGIDFFHVELQGQYDEVKSFSPTTYRISVLAHNQLCVMNIRNSECLLEEEGDPESPHCFSSDGSLFATSSSRGIYIWKYTSGHYAMWRKFTPQRSSITFYTPPQFSPASSSILGCPTGALQVWHLDSPPVITNSNSHTLLTVLSRCGTYMAACHRGDSTITITNLLSPTPPQFIDTDMGVDVLALTGDVLFVWDGNELVGWWLAKKGIADGTFLNKRANRSDSIWTIAAHDPIFMVTDQTVIIKEGEGDDVLHVYHTGTGEVLDLANAPPHLHSHWYSPWDMLCGWHYPHYCNPWGRGILSEDDCRVSPPTLQGEWVKDSRGRNRLWIPMEWRTGFSSIYWLYDIMTLCLEHQNGTAIIML